MLTQHNDRRRAPPVLCICLFRCLELKQKLNNELPHKIDAKFSKHGMCSRSNKRRAK